MQLHAPEVNARTTWNSVAFRRTARPWAAAPTPWNRPRRLVPPLERQRPANGDHLFRLALSEVRTGRGQCLQDRPGAWHLVGSEQVRLAQSGQHGKERLGTADLLSEEL